MTARARQLVVPIYLFFCLLLGGSAQGIWGNAIIQVAGLAIIGWAVVESRSEPMLAPARHMLWIALAAIAIVAFQLVPLPGSAWPHLGGREALAADYRLLGMTVPARPLSLTPYRTIDSLLFAIPPLAVFLGVVRLKAFRAAYAAIALILSTIAGIGLSALQIASLGSPGEAWYLYPVSNVGLGVGFFANANHMGLLLVVSLPFLAALVRGAKGLQVQRYSAFVAVSAAVAILIGVGIALNGSLAAFGLSVPVALSSIAILVPGRRMLRRGLLAGAALLLVGTVGAMSFATIGRATIQSEAADSVRSRAEIIDPTLAITRDFLPFGTGLGSFVRVYPMSEDPATVTSTYVIHAHNDYAEWAMETGLPGIVVMVLFLVWCARASIAIWRRPEIGAFARAATVASAAVLAHSLVDFPLRTSALASLFALSVALLADRRPPQVASRRDLRPTRHVELR